MGFKFSTGEKILELDFKYDDQTLHLWVDANALSGKVLKDINEGLQKRMGADTGVSQPAAVIEGLATMLAKVIKKWNAEDAEPTLDFLMTLPVGLLSKLANFVMESAGPKQETAEA